jgi:membrane protein
MRARLESSPLSPWIRALRDFNRHRGVAHAAALSYTSLLALVPLVALVLSISKGALRSQDPALLLKAVDHFLSYAVPQLQYLPADQAASARQDALTRIQDAISRIDAGALGALGALTLISIGISLLTAIERSLNDIWGVKRGRSLSRRVAYYWAGVTLGPLFLFLAIGITGSNAGASVLGHLPPAFVARAFWRVLPFVILSTGLTLLYWTMPNTHVPARAAVRGGITAGTLVQLNNVASALYFSQVLHYSKVYGSLGAIPVMMLGLYLSWVIVLYGAEVAHAAASPEAESLPFPEGEFGRARIVLEVARLATAAFLSGRGGLSRADLAEQSHFPDTWVGSALDLLREKGFFVAAADDGDGPFRYLPARPPGEIALLDILTAIRRPTKDEAGLPEPTVAVAEFLSRMSAAERVGVGHLSLETLARGAPG